MAVIHFGVVLLLNAQENDRAIHKILGTVYQAKRRYD